MSVPDDRDWLPPTDAPAEDPESSLRSSWSIGPLRPWLKMIAERELPADLRGRIEPSDVVQETLMDAWRGESGFRGRSNPQRLAWLRVILRRVVLQHRRRLLGTKKRGDGIERSLTDALGRTSMRLDELAEGNEPAPEQAVTDAERSLLLAGALERLPQDYRRIIQLRHFDGLNHDEIATRLGRSQAATRMLWVRALVALRKSVDETTSEELNQ